MFRRNRGLKMRSFRLANSGTSLRHFKQPAKTPSVLTTFAVLAVLVTNMACGGSKSPTTPSPSSPNLSGSWRGTWQSARGPSGSVTASLTHTGSSLTGTASLTGSPCFTSGTVSGTVAGGSVTIGVAFPGSHQVNFTGTADSTGGSMNGQYAVTGGACSGDAGTWSMTKQ